MELSNRRAQQYEAGVVSVVEAAVLAGSVGETFEAVVVDLHEQDGGATVQLHEPAVLARASGDGLALGEQVAVRLLEADVMRRLVRFAVV
jgi:hypothetical protein